MSRAARSLAVTCLLVMWPERRALAGPASAELADLAAQIAAVQPGQASFDLCVPDEVLGQEGPLHAAMAARGLYPHDYSMGERCRIYHYRPGEPRESAFEVFNGMLGAALAVTALISGVAALVLGARTRRRVARDEARGGCVACGSARVRIAGDTITCLDCNYTGRSDRGGALLEAEIAATRPQSANGP